MLSTDHPFEYLGGLSLAVRHLDGASPALYIADLRQRQPRTTAAAQFLASELRGRYLSPQWIAAMQREATPAAWKCSTWPTTCGAGRRRIAPWSAPTSGRRCTTPSSSDRRELGLAEWFGNAQSDRPGADHRAHGRGHPQGLLGRQRADPPRTGRALAATGGRRRRRGRRGDHP
ncbi:cobaltochelatase subunit CobN [Pseudomonas aeruginosa]|nr:cobaltochelatase subunit CobN [Pseudomonas aeruginosa]